jgi:predicted lactoylglutathione lyase
MIKMANVHYFQRYSTKENVVTNNTLLLLSQIYSYKEEYLETMLGEINDGLEVPIGLNFKQQVAGENSVPDGVIEQNSFKILIETKRGKSFRESQLNDHMNGFEDEKYKVLLVITTSENSTQKKRNLIKTAEKRGIQLVFTTFNSIISAARKVFDEYEYEMENLISDYEEFCLDSNLLPRHEYRMIAFPCGRSYKENIDYKLYYEPPTRSFRDHKYLGIYHNKTIRAIGEVKKHVIVKIKNDKVISEDNLNENERKRILAAYKEAKDKRDWDLSGNRFYLLDEIYETEYNKVSPGGMRGKQYFDLGYILETEKLPDVKEIAESLSEKEWE